MAITKVINDAVDLNQTTDYSGLRLPVGTTGNVVESFTTDYLVVGGGGSGSLQGAGGAGGLRTSYNNSTTTTNTLSFPSGKTAIATYMLDNNATDVSENYNGAETNITYNTGQYGGAAVFNGSSSYIQADGIFSSSPSVMSASVWFKTTVDGNILDIGDSSVSTAQNRIFFSSGLLYVSLNGGGGGFASTSATGLQDGNWHHIVAVWDDGTVTNGIKMYIDEQLLQPHKAILRKVS